MVCIALLVLVSFLLFTRCGGKEKYSADGTGICSQAGQNGADSTFVNTCRSYRGICGENSTTTVVQQIDGSVGLNSDQADSMMQTCLSFAQQNKSQCCDPNSPDTSFCTGNTN